MNSEIFNGIVERRLSLITSILLNKSKEYSKNDNRLHNFDMASEIGQESREKALKGMMMKHVVSTFDMINLFEDNDSKAINNLTDAYIEEKIGDFINYLILLEAMIKEDAALNKMLKDGLKDLQV
jgi:hypothetical protein